jgi:hypothetical protein
MEDLPMSATTSSVILLLHIVIVKLTYRMSKKLNRRQQRELQELEQLKAAQREVEASKADSDEEEEEDDEPGGGPVNAFAAVRVSALFQCTGV